MSQYLIPDVCFCSDVNKLLDRGRRDLLIFGGNEDCCDAKELVMLKADLSSVAVSVDDVDTDVLSLF